MASLLKGFQKFFHQNPRLANCLVYGSFYVSAEFSQQHLTKKILIADGKQQPYDWSAIGRYAIIGSAIYPNCLLLWYKWLDNKYVGTTTKIVTKKLFLDSFILTPVMIFVFFTGMSILERRRDIFTEFQLKFKNVFQTSCVFWIPAQLINFKFIPPVGRVVYMGGCSLIWVNILCWFKRRSVSPKNTNAIN